MKHVPLFWEAIESAFKLPGEPTPLSADFLNLALHLQSVWPLDGTDCYAAVYGERLTDAVMPAALATGASCVHGTLYRDWPDRPAQSNRVRLRAINAGSTVTLKEPYIYCQGMQRPDKAAVDAITRAREQGYELQERPLAQVLPVTLHLIGVARRANMHSQPWWGVFAAMYGFELPTEAPTLPKGFVIGQSTVRASCLLERPDDPQDTSLRQLTPLTVTNGQAALDGDPVHYRSITC